MKTALAFYVVYIVLAAVLAGLVTAGLFVLEAWLERRRNK